MRGRPCFPVTPAGMPRVVVLTLTPIGYCSLGTSNGSWGDAFSSEPKDFWEVWFAASLLFYWLLWQWAVVVYAFKHST